MDKKIILIIGASSGIGKFISTMLVRENNIVINADITNSAASNWTIDSHIYEVHLDVTSNNQIIDLANDISTKFGVLDTLIYAPAPSRSNRKSFPENLDSVDNELNILLKGAMSCIRFFYPVMLGSRNPSILLLGSILGSLIAHESLGYHLSKSALIHGMNYFAVNLAKHNIRVNMISPGLVKRQHSADNSGEPTESQNLFDAYIKYAVPLGRSSEYEDIYQATSYLISDKAKYITGSNLTLDGGLSLQEPFNLARNFRIT